MLFSKINTWMGKLSFQLSIRYLVIFVLTSILLLSIFYYRISAVTMEMTDEELGLEPELPDPDGPEVEINPEDLVRLDEEEE